LKENTMTRLTTILSLAAGLALANPALGQGTVHVSDWGSFDPTGAASDPYDTIPHGIEHMDGTGATTLKLLGGVYPDTGVFDRPMTITSSGAAFVGATPVQSFRFEVAAYNTHIYGNAIPVDEAYTLSLLGIINPVHWLDGQRLADITTIYSNSTADVVAFQEVWDPDAMVGLAGGAGFPWFAAGDRVDSADVEDCIQLDGYGCFGSPLNSGLVTGSRHPITTQGQIGFAFESGSGDFFEPLASKGWVFTEVLVSGVPIAIYNTHMQAGDESDSGIRFARFQQLVQLRNAILEYRDANPSVPVIIAGDLNIRSAGSATSEYQDTLRPMFDTPDMPFVDAARADFSNRALNAITSDDDNRLNQYWGGGDGGDKRLDYILYAHSRDGSVRLIHEETRTLKNRGPAHTFDGVTTTEKSDHWAVHTTFNVIRY
jgi:endonuclease/exonuclease/phosphatase family metal-dependent hydrolase